MPISHQIFRGGVSLYYFKYGYFKDIFTINTLDIDIYIEKQSLCYLFFATLSQHIHALIPEQLRKSRSGFLFEVLTGFSDNFIATKGKIVI